MTEDTEKKGERAQSCNWISGVEQLQIYVGSKKSDVPSYNECVSLYNSDKKGYDRELMQWCLLYACLLSFSSFMSWTDL